MNLPRIKGFFIDRDSAISESLTLGILLAIVGGFLDSYSYITRDKVFANAQTGNMVLLGINLADGDFVSALHYLFPILAFSAGVIVSEMLKGNESNNLHWRQVVIGIEFLVLLGVAFFSDDSWNYYTNVAISFVCSMQVQAFRRLHGTPFATTMCTGNLRSATEFFCAGIKEHNRQKFLKTLQYLSIIICFILGAWIGTFFTYLWDAHAVLFCNFILILVFCLLFAEKYFTSTKNTR